MLPVAVVKMHDGDLHAVGWGEGPSALVTPVKAICALIFSVFCSWSPCWGCGSSQSSCLSGTRGGGSLQSGKISTFQLCQVIKWECLSFITASTICKCRKHLCYVRLRLFTITHFKMGFSEIHLWYGTIF